MVGKEVLDELTTFRQIAQPGEMTGTLDGVELCVWQELRNVLASLTAAKGVPGAPEEQRWLLDLLELLLIEADFWSGPT